MYSARCLKCVLLLTPLVFCTTVHAGRAYFEERREVALMQCLNHNYTSLGAYEVRALKDYSVWTYKLYTDYKFSVDGSSALNDFIEKNAGDFYKENLPVQSEVERPPYNAIFARCMAFYKSKKLKYFLLHHKP